MYVMNYRFLLLRMTYTMNYYLIPVYRR